MDLTFNGMVTKGRQTNQLKTKNSCRDERRKFGSKECNRQTRDRSGWRYSFRGTFDFQWAQTATAAVGGDADNEACFGTKEKCIWPHSRCVLPVR